METGDALEALRILRTQAVSIEPAATRHVQRAAAHVAGELLRLDTRFKTEASIVAKLERLARRRSPRYSLDRFNDGLRYTIVLDDDRYWTGCLAAIDALGTDGFQVTTDRQTLGWQRRYAGLSVTVEDTSERRFEVQFHAPASLAAAEASHAQYALWRSIARRALPRALAACCSCPSAASAGVPRVCLRPWPGSTTSSRSPVDGTST